MPDTPTTALIAGASSVISACLPLLWNSFKERAVFAPVDAGRPTAISGEWAGSGKDTYVQNGDTPVAIKLHFSIKATRNTIRCKVVVSLQGPDPLSPEPQPPIVLEMNGGFFSESLVQVSYRSVDRNRVQYGVMLLELNDVANTIVGHYSGFSPVRRCLVVGTLELRKAA